MSMMGWPEPPADVPPRDDEKINRDIEAHLQQAVLRYVGGPNDGQIAFIHAGWPAPSGIGHRDWTGEYNLDEQRHVYVWSAVAVS